MAHFGSEVKGLGPVCQLAQGTLGGSTPVPSPRPPVHPYYPPYCEPLSIAPSPLVENETSLLRTGQLVITAVFKLPYNNNGRVPIIIRARCL
jgi:hypothetical protein